MANEKLKQNYKNIANSIRAKTGKNGTIKADEMAAEIDSIETGIEPTGTINITTNGTHNVAQYGEANVNVPNPSTGTKNITTNGDHDVTAFATAHVAVPGPSGTRYITENGTDIDVARYQYVDVSVPPALPQYLIDLNSNQFIYDHHSIHNCAASVDEDDGDINIAVANDGLNLSEVNEDCSNLYSIVYSYFGYSTNITLPLILLDDSGTIDVECPLDTSTWPWWEEKSEVLREALNGLSFDASDLLNYNLGTIWFHQSGGS